MMKKTNLNIPQKSLWYLFICGGIILFVILAIIFPLYKYNANSAKEIKVLENKIVAQKELGPIYMVLTKAMKEKKEPTLPDPVKEKISREEAGTFVDVFKKIANKTNLKIVSITPDLGSLAGNESFLLQNAVVKGEFANFREFIIEVGKIPYVEKIEEVNIRQLVSSMELRAKIWLALR